MKKIKFLSFLMSITLSFALIQCTTDAPEAIVGPQGPPGVDGTDGVDGADGTASCVECHSDSHRAPIINSYTYSGHAEGGAVGYAGSRAACAQCHSNEGYIDYMTYGYTDPDGYENPTPISCTSCHDSHSTFDFENDGHDYALRHFAPVTLMTDPDYTIDYGDTSNNCASCHQPRTLPPLDDGAGMFEVTSTHWGPHHSPQSTLLEGIQGALIPGTEGYPGVGSAVHRTESSCVECHMGEASSSTVDGEHSFIPTATACTTCHPNGAPAEAEGFTEDMEALATLLENIGIVHEGHPVVGTYTITEAEAAWNYLLAMEDGSKGAHNPKYVKALIKNSIEVLD